MIRCVCTYCVQQLVLIVALYWHDDCPHTCIRPGVFQAILTNLCSSFSRESAIAGSSPCSEGWVMIFLMSELLLA
jgi:hypothetical protein